MAAPLLRCLPLAFVACALTACGPKLVRERVYDKPTARVELRHTIKGGEIVKHGYAQPATIADVRIAHILASLSYEDSEGKLKPVIRSQFVYELADGIEAALAKATPDDEIGAASFPEDRRLGIFTDDRVTAFRLVLIGEEMQLEFYAIEQGLEREGSKIVAREYEIPSELPGMAPAFKIVPGTAQTRLGPRGVKVAWRDEYFRKPVTLSFRQGQARRRTVLMDSPPEQGTDAKKPGGPEDAPLPANVSDLQIRALDQLDAARQSGLVKESDYQSRRKLILENRLDEAGYGNLP